MSGGFKAPAYDPYDRYKNTGDGAFGFRKDKHVIIPGVTGYEERRLERIQEYVENETGKPCTLPQELINDVYSMFVNKNVKRRPTDGMNEIRHKVLDKVYDSFTKMVTADSPLYTQVLTKELALTLQKVDDEIREDQNDQEDGSGSGKESGLSSSTGNGEEDGVSGESIEGDGKDEDRGEAKGNEPSTGAGKGSGGETRKSIEDIVDEALERAEDSIEKAKKEASNTVENLNKQLGENAVKDLERQDPEFLEKIEELKDRLEKVSINKESIRKVMDKILNESMNYFSPKFKRVEESLFECEECEDMFGLEFLHPIFRNAEIMNVGNETRIYKGKIDLYLDCSGSMNNSRMFEGTHLRMIDLVKGIAMVLYRMGMIENLYFFNGNVIPIDNPNEVSILSFSKGGGTDFNEVVDNIKRTGNNSVIITDGNDNCQEYVKQAFWVGVGGTNFDRKDAFLQYKDNKQCVAYNPSTSKFNYCSK